MRFPGWLLGSWIGLLAAAGCSDPGDGGPIVLPSEPGVGGTSSGGSPAGTGGEPAPTVECPAIEGAAGLGSVCGSQDSVFGPGNRYYFQNNIWNQQGSSQCIEPYTFGDFAGFRVASANHAVTNDAPAAYPSVVKGWHWGFKTSDYNAGRPLSAITSVPSLWCFATTTGDKYNVSYDIWLHPTSSAPSTPNGGMELMVWLHREDPENGVWPIGVAQDRFQYQGSWWRIYLSSTQDNPNWTVLSYMRETNVNAAELDLKFFFDDAIDRGYLSPSWYLLGVEAGFEIWRGGTGLQSVAYQVEVR
jgi:hypothetical protein